MPTAHCPGAHRPRLTTARFALAAVCVCLTLGMTVPFAHAATPLTVAVSIPPQKYFVERIGGDAVAVTVMTAKGRDPHSYEPTAAQMRAVSTAELYLAIGVPFETQWLPKFRAQNPALRVLALMDHVARVTGKPDLALRAATGRRGHGDHAHGLETDDPHVWLSPLVMENLVPVMVEALTAARPEHAARFAENGRALMAETAALNTEIAAMFAPLPSDKRAFLTFHQGWAYYARNYSLREASVETGGREPSPGDMAKLMTFAAENNLRVIVADAMTGGSAVTAIAASVGATVITATPLEENWPESMRAVSRSLAGALMR